MITNSITVDICLSVWLKQIFVVPADYEIKGSTSMEAYQHLIADFSDQNIDAVEDANELGLNDDDVMSIDFKSFGDEFVQLDNQTNKLNFKRFDNTQKQK